jgi:hypothetical protein
MADDVAKTKQELEMVKSTVTEKIDRLIEHIDKATR